MLNALKSIGKAVGKFVLNQFGLSIDGVKNTAGTVTVQGTDTLTVMLTKIAEQQLAGARAALTGEVKRLLASAVVEQTLLEYFHVRGMKLKDGHDFAAHVNAAVGGLYDVWDDFEGDVKTIDVGKVVPFVAPPTPPAQG